VHTVPDPTFKSADTVPVGASGSADASGALVHPDTGGATADTPATEPDTRPADTRPADTRPVEGSGKPPEQRCNDEDVPCLKGFGSGQ
jgi:hypothetical protein